MLESRWEQRYNCTLSRSGGLCDIDSQTLKGIVFPTLSAPLINEDFDRNCSGSRDTGRIIASVAAVGQRYDFSMCDVAVDEKDFLYVDNRQLFITTNHISDWTYWVMCVLIIFIVRCLSRYILMAVHNNTTNDTSNPDAAMEKAPAKTPEKSDITMHPLICLAAGVVLLMAVLMQGTDMYVTQEDVFFYHCTIAYCAAYLLIFFANKVVWEISLFCSNCNDSPHDPPFYNVLCGVLLLSVMRFYSGAETPYNGPLLFIIALRMFVKIQHPWVQRSSHAITTTAAEAALCNATLMMDAFMITLMCEVGFRYQWEYNIAVISAAVVAADALIHTG